MKSKLYNTNQRRNLFHFDLLHRYKSDVAKVIKGFCWMVKRQYETNTKWFCTDNGSKYVNNKLQDYWSKDGIVDDPIVPYFI